ncbi:MAG: anti-sigma factor domain-containing protein [Cellulosilyticaceae bacterium]
MIQKGIIMSIEEDHAIILAKGGGFLQLQKKSNMKVGQKILFTEDDIIESPSSSRHTPMRMLPVVAAIILLFMIPVSLLSSQPHAILSMDINPSIELALTKKGTIHSIEGRNLDADALSLQSLKGLEVSEAMSRLQDQLIAENYLTPDEYILVGFTQLRGNDSSIENLTKSALLDTFSDTNIIYLPATKEDYQNAQKAHLSLGRYEAGLLSSALADDIELDNLSVEDLAMRLKSTNTHLLSGELLDELLSNMDDDDRDDDIITNNSKHNTSNNVSTPNDNNDDNDNDDDVIINHSKPNTSNNVSTPKDNNDDDNDDDDIIIDNSKPNTSNNVSTPKNNDDRNDDDHDDDDSDDDDSDDDDSDDDDSDDDNSDDDNSDDDDSDDDNDDDND